MDAVVWIIIIGVVVAVVWVGMQNMQKNNAALGVPASEAHRVLGLNYLGGYPGAAAASQMCNLVVTPAEVAVEKGAKLLLRVPMAEVHEVLVETEEEAKRRLTATRLLTIGIFALAFPKKTKGSVLVTVDTAQGPIMLEKAKTTKPDMLKKMGPALSLARQHGRGPRSAAEVSAQADSAPRDVADELRKLGALRDDGLLTSEEFDAQKRRLLDS